MPKTAHSIIGHFSFRVKYRKENELKKNLQELWLKICFKKANDLFGDKYKLQKQQSITQLQ